MEEKEPILYKDKNKKLAENLQNSSVRLFEKMNSIYLKVSK